MIDTSLIKSDTVVKCNTLEEAKELFDAMGWNPCLYTDSCPYSWRGKPVYFWRDGDEWNSVQRLSNRSVDVIYFSELKVSVPRIAEVLGVKVGQKFKYCTGRKIYWINEDGLRYFNSAAGPTIEYDERSLIEMINHPEKVQIINEYSEQTIENAKVAIRLGFKDVARTLSSGVFLTNMCGTVYFISSKLFPEVKKGERVKLSDIINGV